MHKVGFTLIELLVYVALLSFLSHLIFSFTLQSAKQGMHIGKKVTQQSQALISFDLLIRDLRAAPSRKEDWKKIAPHECVWHCKAKEKDLGWMLEGNRLLRITGFYDMQAGRWTTKRRDVVMQGVSKILFRLVHDHNQIRAVICMLELQGEQMPFEQWVTVRERTL